MSLKGAQGVHFQQDSWKKPDSFKEVIFNKDLSSRSAAKGETKAHVPMAQSQSLNGWGGKGPLEIIWSIPLLKQGHLKHIAWDPIQAGIEYYQGRRLHNLCQHSDTLTVGKFSLYSDGTSCSLCLVPLILSLKPKQARKVFIFQLQQGRWALRCSKL